MIDATRSTHNQEIVNSYVTGYNKGKLDSKIEFIEKACNWLLDNTGKYMVVSGGGYWFNDIEFIKDFKTHLEE